MQRAGLDAPTRLALFQFVCVPARVLLAIIITRLPPYLVASGAALSTAYLLAAPPTVAWSRKRHAAFAASIALAAAAGNANLAGAIALVDVAYGAFTHRPR